MPLMRTIHRIQDVNATHLRLISKNRNAHYQKKKKHMHKPGFLKNGEKEREKLSFLNYKHSKPTLWYSATIVLLL
jgi:hypothetical protein